MADWLPVRRRTPAAVEVLGVGADPLLGLGFCRLGVVWPAWCSLKVEDGPGPGLCSEEHVGLCPVQHTQVWASWSNSGSPCGKCAVHTLTAE